MIRRVGDVPHRDRRYRRRPGVYAILPLAGRFLMAVQTADKVDVMLPGGGVDAGEHPLQALYREVLEETGWSIAGPLRLGAFRRFAYMPEYDLWAEKLCTVYLARPIRQIADPTEPDHRPVLMSGPKALETLENDGDRMFLQHYMATC